MLDGPKRKEYTAEKDDDNPKNKEESGPGRLLKLNPF